MINYILLVLLCQLLFLTVYDLFFNKETFFTWNRIYLIVTPILSFLIPILKFEQVKNSVSEEIIEQLPLVVLNPEVVINQTVEQYNYSSVIANVFYIGLTISLLIFLTKLGAIILLIIKNETVKKSNYTLVLLEKSKSAFSFFRFIFLKKDFLKSNNLDIVRHEMVHCRQFHSLDLLFFEVLKIAMWFNPLIYVYQKRITELHEYISDAEVVNETDKASYFNALLAETFNVENISFINQYFKQSLIKKRIAMITKNKSQKIKQLKYLFMLPLIAFMLVLSSFEERSLTNSNSESMEHLNVGQQELIDQKVTIAKDTIVSFALIENVPVYPGCTGTNEELKKCLQDKITEHVNKNFDVKQAKNLGLSTGLERIFVMFKINEKGKVVDIQARASHKILEELAIKVVNEIPQMQPGKHKGKVVGVKYSLPIAFKVEGNSILESVKVALKDESKNQNIETDEVSFSEIDNVPVFPGCSGTEDELRDCLKKSITAHVNENFNKDIAKGLELPKEYTRIYVMFKINTEGKIESITARAPHELLVEEAERVIATLPKNIVPGKHNGKPVAIKYALPIAINAD